MGASTLAIDRRATGLPRGLGFAVVGPDVSIVDATVTVILLPAAAWPPDSAVMAGDIVRVGVLSPGFVPLLMMWVSGPVTTVTNPSPPFPAKMPTADLPCTVIVPLS